ncbi:flavin-containing monooxygenase [Plakobranchus ocellatus]|uniref:Flavin-containing monooxygenase n=1 Tax=Plakobranchus ocellatus TaxID=259542 RepID=A0AAV4DLI5_9GAST|nr:flavin-containing monooxygenase [Plakobranchus ocellatus]
MHSHDYRHPEKFSNQVLVLLGAGLSGRDIAMGLSEVATKGVSINLYSIKSAAINPRSIKGVGINLYSIKSAAIHPRSIKGIGINLYSIKSAAINPRSIKGVGYRYKPLLYQECRY